MLGAELNPLTRVKRLSGQAAKCWQVFGYCCVPNKHYKSQRSANLEMISLRASPAGHASTAECGATVT